MKKVIEINKMLDDMDSLITENDSEYVNSYSVDGLLYILKKLLNEYEKTAVGYKNFISKLSNTSTVTKDTFDLGLSILRKDDEAMLKLLAELRSYRNKLRDRSF